MPGTRLLGGSLGDSPSSSALPSSSTNYNSILILLLAVVGLFNCHGTYHSFDVP